METEVTKSASQPQNDIDYPTDLAKMFKDTISALTEVKIREVPASQVFFPNGIGYIHLVIKVGAADAPLFSAEIEISEHNKTLSFDESRALVDNITPKAS